MGFWARDGGCGSLCWLGWGGRWETHLVAAAGDVRELALERRSC
jgi:hypothetical protein